MLTTFIDWLVNIISTLGYPGVGLSMFIESFFPPIPSEVILPFSGFVASQGTLNIWLVIIVATLGAYLGSLPFYIIGYLGDKKLHSFLDKYGKYILISKGDIDKGYKILEKYGSSIVMLGRIVPVIRSVISFPAGMTRMNFLVFSIYTILGTALWSTLLAYAGFYLGEKWEYVEVFIGKYENIILILLAIIFIAYIIRGILNIKKEKESKTLN